MSEFLMSRRAAVLGAAGALVKTARSAGATYYEPLETPQVAPPENDVHHESVAKHFQSLLPVFLTPDALSEIHGGLLQDSEALNMLARLGQLSQDPLTDEGHTRFLLTLPGRQELELEQIYEVITPVEKISLNYRVNPERYFRETQDRRDLRDEDLIQLITRHTAIPISAIDATTNPFSARLLYGDTPVGVGTFSRGGRFSYDVRFPTDLV